MNLPVFCYLFKNHEQLNEALRSLILSKEQISKGVNASNVGGWHSQRDLAHWEDECIKTIMTFIIERVRMVSSQCGDVMNNRQKWRIIAWANVNRYGDYNKLHNHITYPKERNQSPLVDEKPIPLWSGVYYVDLGICEKPSQVGCIGFQESHSDSLKTVKIVPKRGLILLFPSSLNHEVMPYLGKSERISISFNAYYQDDMTLPQNHNTISIY